MKKILLVTMTAASTAFLGAHAYNASALDRKAPIPSIVRTPQKVPASFDLIAKSLKKSGVEDSKIVAFLHRLAEDREKARQFDALLKAGKVIAIPDTSPYWVESIKYSGPSTQIAATPPQCTEKVQSNQNVSNRILVRARVCATTVGGSGRVKAWYYKKVTTIKWVLTRASTIKVWGKLQRLRSNGSVAAEWEFSDQKANRTNLHASRFKTKLPGQKMRLLVGCGIANNSLQACAVPPSITRP